MRRWDSADRLRKGYGVCRRSAPREGASGSVTCTPMAVKHMVALEFSAFALMASVGGPPQMLRFLRIEHLAVIDALEVEFEPGLNVLTGETGAGKSMLVEGVGLLLGGRASADLVRTGESQATVQAVFDLPAAAQPDAELIVRREVTSQGRSRAFVNDELVTAAALKDHTAALVELHGQHEHQTLLDPQSHLALLDSFAGLAPAREQVAAAFREWRLLQSQFDALQLDEREKAARLDLLNFQVGELERAALRPGEDEELATARRVLANAEKLQRLCGEAYEALYNSDQAALASLAGVWKRVAELADVDSAFQPHVEARDAIKSQLEDLAAALRSYGDDIDASPARLQQVEDRLAVLERIKRKYGPTLADAVAAKDTLARQLDSLKHAGERRASLEAESKAAREEFLKRARALSKRRRDAALDFATRLQNLLGDLAMGRARLEVRFDGDAGEAAWSEQGVDVAECYLSANVGEDLRPLARIASGGELSRVMLAIRTLAAAGTPGKTLIFDEIDAGIGGRVAGVVGRNLSRLGETYQVLCITHLPQIAASGHAHFRIEKSVVRGRTVTKLARLDRDDRIEEVARMIGGAVATEATRAAARELLGESERRKAKPAP
jgi:DNA repair protein RecN (Recombination protein N)